MEALQYNLLSVQAFRTRQSVGLREQPISLYSLPPCRPLRSPGECALLRATPVELHAVSGTSVLVNTILRAELNFVGR